MNRYQVIPMDRGVPPPNLWRIRLYGAVLGASLPALIAGVAYWVPGGGFLPVLGLWGAIVGLVAGALYADQVTASESPVRTALYVAWKTALGGTLAIVIPCSALFFVPALGVGLVLGGMLSLPVAVVSVAPLRLMTRRPRLARTIAIGLAGLALVVAGFALVDVAHGSPRRASVDVTARPAATFEVTL